MSSLSEYIRISFLKLKKYTLFCIANTGFHLSSYHPFAAFILDVPKYPEMQFADSVTCIFILLSESLQTISVKTIRFQQGLQLNHASNANIYS